MTRFSDITFIYICDDTSVKTECSITFKESNNHLIDPQSLAVSMAKRLGIMLRSFLFLLAIGSISAKK